MLRTIVTLCILCCIAINNTTLSQTNFISIQDMISNFSVYQTVYPSEFSQDNMHLIKGFQTSEPSLIINKDLFPLSKLKLDMEHLGTEWDLVYTPLPDNPLRRILTLEKIKGKNGAYFMNQLAEKYGRNEKGIPALWYSGKICVLLCPRNLFGEVVSKRKIILTVSQGIIEAQSNVPIKVGNMENVPRNGVMTLDGCWYSASQYNNFHPLEEFVHQKVLKSSIKSYTFSLLLVTDEQGRGSGYVLFPKNIKDKKEKLLVDDLLKRISQLPPWSFGWMETIGGKVFRGRYLKAIYLSDIGWTFEDYILK